MSLPMPISADSTCTYTELWSLPEWFSESKRIDEPYKISCRLNPFYQRGDFDGDGQGDLAVLITNTKSGKHGIAVVRRASGALTVMGAGVPFDGDDDDFSWLDVWRVEPPPVRSNAWKEVVPEFRGEVLYLEKSESAGGWAGIVGDRVVWYQGSD
jgi:hypothetical protein